MKTLKHIFTITFVTLCTTLCVDTNISAMKRGAGNVEASSLKRRKISKKQEARYKQNQLESLYDRGINYFYGTPSVKKNYQEAYECLTRFLDKADPELFAITQIIRAQGIVSHITSLSQQLSNNQQSQQTSASSSSSSSTSTIVQAPVGGSFSSTPTSAFVPVITTTNSNASTSTSTSTAAHTTAAISTSSSSTVTNLTQEEQYAALVLQTFLVATAKQQQ
jgi:hypothetical protein